MSLCVMLARSIRRLNEQHGTAAVHGAAHHDGRSVLCTATGGITYWIDRRTGAIELTAQGTWSLRNFGRRST